LSSFYGIRFIGESITTWLAEPAFDYLWKPLVKIISAALGGGGFIHNILVGKLISGDIDFVQSFGLLTTGLFVPLGMVFPFVFVFYLWLGILEDIGYLPRLAVLLDRLMHKLGLHGWAIIPNLLGLGCNVPAILATRILEDRRERLIACTLVSVALPCAALQAMIWALVGNPAKGGGIGHVLIVYGVLFASWLLIGWILAKILPGTSPELLMEIPPYRRPYWPTVLKNLRLRITGFLREAIPIVLIGVLVVNILYWFKVFDALASVTAPVMTKFLGLPKEAIVAVAVGFFRKDMAMGLLATMDLTIKQLVVASTVLAMFFPCIATFIVLIKEIGWRGMAFSVIVMIVFSMLAGGMLNVIL
ncbi:MAG: nucleoside recognition domain-containing protein, partial [Candidatus Komeilibacteria bacterium]|nr:nucleoside recognition domain-containing protein [Candidatus Komeilibacteria bacterium]